MHESAKELTVTEALERAQAEILSLEQQLAEKKRAVNILCGLVNRSPVYANADPLSGPSASIRSDEFYGKRLATAVRSILEKRSALGLGAGSIDEIYDGLTQGGYRFEAKNDATAKRSLSTSLAKNTTTFHKLPNGNFGLLEWYPEAKVTKKSEENGRADEHDDDGQYPNDFAEDKEKEAESQTATKEKRKKRETKRIVEAAEKAEAPAEVNVKPVAVS